jgi:hypothetical protein
MLNKKSKFTAKNAGIKPTILLNDCSSGGKRSINS